MELNYIKIQAPLRIDFCGGFTDVLEISKLVGTSIINISIDLYDKENIIDFYIKKVDSPNLSSNSEIVYNFEKFIYNSEVDSKYAFLKTDIPESIGIGTSSAVITMIAHYFNKIKKASYSDKDICHQVNSFEKEILNINGGFQDIIASMHGGCSYICVGSIDEYYTNRNKKNKIAWNIDTKLGENFINYINNFVIIVVSLRKHNSSYIINDILNNLDDVFKIKKLQQIKKYNEEFFNLLNNCNYKNTHCFNRLFSIIQKSWHIQKELSSYLNNSLLNLIEHECSNEVFAIHGAGAGGGALILYSKPKHFDNLVAKLKRLSVTYEIKTYFPRANFQGVQNIYDNIEI